MEVKATELKASKSPEKGKLYELGFRETPYLITVEEKHDDGGLDQVVLEYCMKDRETGYFAYEYLPDNVTKDGNSRIDITAAIVNHKKNYIRWHLYDIKRTLAGEKTVLTLNNQWNAGLGYLRQSVLSRIPGYLETPDLGVITGHYDEERMIRVRDQARSACEDTENHQILSLAQRKKRVNIARYRAVLQASQAILDRTFQTKDGMNTYKIHIRIMGREDDRLYKMKFPV